jgi:RimJ/RimL family protein N-acetyltransferase
VSDAPHIIDVVPRIAATGDAPAVRALTCAGRTPRYGNTAQKLVRRCGSVLAGTVAEPPGFRCLLFEDLAAKAADRLVGVSAVRDADDGICDWIVMGIARPLHGGRVPDGRSLATAIAEETARFARDQGYRRMVAQVHRDHQKSLHIVGQLGFVVATALDVDYSLYAVDLTDE